jgi:hypothetical protein
MALASPLARSVATTKYMPRPLRAFELGRQYGCPIVLDSRNVIWIHREGQWQVFERPWWEAMR